MHQDCQTVRIRWEKAKPPYPEMLRLRLVVRNCLQLYSVLTGPHPFRYYLGFSCLHQATIYAMYTANCFVVGPHVVQNYTHVTRLALLRLSNSPGPERA